MLFLVAALLSFDSTAGANPLRWLWDRCRGLEKTSPVAGQEFVQIPLLLFDQFRSHGDRMIVAKVVAVSGSRVTLDSGLLQHDLKPITQTVPLKTLRVLQSGLVPPSAAQALSAVRGIREFSKESKEGVGSPEVPFYWVGGGEVQASTVSQATQLVSVAHSQVVGFLSAAGISTPPRTFRVLLNTDPNSASQAHVQSSVTATGTVSHPQYLPHDATIVLGSNTVTPSIVAHEVSHRFDPMTDLGTQRYHRHMMALPGWIAYDPLRETWADYGMYLATRSPIVTFADGRPLRNIGEKPKVSYWNFLSSRTRETYEGHIPIHDESVYFTYLLFMLGQKYGEQNVVKSFYDLRSRQFEDLTEENTNVPWRSMGKAELESAARQGPIIAYHLLRWIRAKHPEWEPETRELFKSYGLLERDPALETRLLRSP